MKFISLNEVHSTDIVLIRYESLTSFVSWSYSFI